MQAIIGGCNGTSDWAFFEIVATECGGTIRGPYREDSETGRGEEDIYEK
jgi:hypothetical protein